jgi:hypothetical protein
MAQIRLLLVVVLFSTSANALAATIVVNDPGDVLHSVGCATTGTGTCTLRDAITFANANPGPDTIHFAFAGPGVQTISVTSELPRIQDPVVIDGTSQPGFAGTPLIELDGSAAGPIVAGLTVFGSASSGSTVKGLVVNGFSNTAIVLANTDGNTIQGNYLGTIASGTAARANIGGVGIYSSNGNQIGGSAPGAGNLISGNTFNGIDIENSSGNVVQGNRIGTDATGMLPIGNLIRGIVVILSSNTTIGGAAPGQGNVVSASGQIGIEVVGSTGNLIAGNLVGVAADGIAALGNQQDGIFIGNGSSGNTVGGVAQGSGNVISGNGFSGVNLAPFGSPSPSNVIQGNLIGTDISGSLPIGNHMFGVWIQDSSANLVGGVTPQAANVISSNFFGGVRIEGSGARSNSVVGNKIGTSSSGSPPLPNGGAGVAVGGSASGNAVGAAGAGNIIAFNLGPGVVIGDAASDTASGNSILFNSIRQNGRLGIDLGKDGVTPNHGTHPQVGPNNLQNFPVLTAVLRSALTGRLVILGNQDSTPASGPNEIQFFLSDGDPSGYGQGRDLLLDMPGQPPGNGLFRTQAFSPPVTIAVGDMITATSTTADGTSEFAQNVGIVGNQPPVANAGPNQSVTLGTSVFLDGSVSVDPDALPAGSAIQNGSFTWTQTSGPSITLANSTTSKPSFLGPVPGAYSFSLVVSDGLDVSTNSATVTITVTGPAISIPVVGKCALLTMIAALALIGLFALRR